MTDTKYIYTFEDFMKDHPEIDPSAASFIQPVFQTAEDQVFSFIMSYIFM